MAFTVRGVEASLVWGYHQAATLGAWTLTRNVAAGVWDLTAAVASTNPFAITRRPLTFVAPHGGKVAGTWRWPVVSIEFTDGALRAVLGPKERS